MAAGNEPELPGSPTARQFHADVEAALTESGRVAFTEDDTGKGLAATVRRIAKRQGRSAWSFMKRHPFVSVLALGAATGALALEVGAAELTLAGAVAFAAYKVLREGEPPLQAIQEVERRV